MICAGFTEKKGVLSINNDHEITAVISFWFGDCVRKPAEIPARMEFWFSNDKATDNEIASRFAGLVRQARSGELAAWLERADGRLALVLLLDQFPRNLFRGTCEAFSSDSDALEICRQCIADEMLESLAPVAQAFMLMPLQHAESRIVQQHSVDEYAKLLQRVEPSARRAFEGFLKYARLHKEIIDRCGRFPHRNAILGRPDTEQERNYLAGNAPRFGQH